MTIDEQLYQLADGPTATQRHIKHGETGRQSQATSVTLTGLPDLAVLQELFESMP